MSCSVTGEYVLLPGWSLSVHGRRIRRLRPCKIGRSPTMWINVLKVAETFAHCSTGARRQTHKSRTHGPFTWTVELLRPFVFCEHNAPTYRSRSLVDGRSGTTTDEFLFPPRDSLEQLQQLHCQQWMGCYYNSYDTINPTSEHLIDNIIHYQCIVLSQNAQKGNCRHLEKPSDILYLRQVTVCKN